MDDPPIPNSSQAGQHQHRCGALSARVAAVAIDDDEGVLKSQPRLAHKMRQPKMVQIERSLSETILSLVHKIPFDNSN